MKKLIKKLLREPLLNEGALTSSHLPEGTGLFVKEKNSSELVLFNPKTKEVYGIINFVYISGNSDFYYVIAVAAEQGFGPLMYQLAMMYIANKHNNYLAPARNGDIKSKAWNIWDKMYQRDDVTKKTLTVTDNKFYYDILFPTEEVGDDEREEAFNELNPNEQRDLLIFNSGYTMKPTSDYQKLTSIAQEYDERTYELASMVGDQLWSSTYV